VFYHDNLARAILPMLDEPADMYDAYMKMHVDQEALLDIYDTIVDGWNSSSPQIQITPVSYVGTPEEILAMLNYKPSKLERMLLEEENPN
jgi:hypothetical protein